MDQGSGYRSVHEAETWQLKLASSQALVWVPASWE